MEEIDYDALFNAAASGDVEMIERHFIQPFMQSSVEHLNTLSRVAYEEAPARHKTPFFVFPRQVEAREFRMRRGMYYPFNESLFEPAAKNNHLHVFAWFCGDTATQTMGDVTRYFLWILYMAVVSHSTICDEVTEMILASPLYDSFGAERRAQALTMMLDGVIEFNQPSTVRLLVAHGARADQPLTMKKAIDRGDVWTIQSMVDSGVEWATYPVEISVNRRDSKVARLLLHHGLDVQSGPCQYSSLHNAARDYDAEILRIWLDEGYADVNVRCYPNVTPLMYAVTYSRYCNGKNRRPIIQALLEFGADVHLRDYDGKTAMHKALVAQDQVMVEELIKAGADLCVRNKHNRTPYDELVTTERGQAFVDAHPQYFPQH